MTGMSNGIEARFVDTPHAWNAGLEGKPLKSPPCPPCPPYPPCLPCPLHNHWRCQNKPGLPMLEKDRQMRGYDQLSR